MSENKILSDLDIAHNAAIVPSRKSPRAQAFTVDALELYGPLQGQDPAREAAPPRRKAPGKMVLVSAMSPDPGR